MRRVVPIVVLAFSGSVLRGQARLDRPPNLAGTWNPAPGVVRFDFVHRFYITQNGGVINFPTFTLAAGLVPQLGLGLRYATKGSAANETEIYARWTRPSGPLMVSLTPVYNVTQESFDGELGAEWTHGALTLSGALRGMSRPFGADRARAAAAAGAVFRLNDYVALGGDVASMLDAGAGEDPAWSVGLLLVIPGSPHTFSLHASNVGANTLQGSSRRDPAVRATTSGKPLYGFEFTIPLHLGRFAPWFHGRRPAAATAGAAAAEVSMAEFAYRADTVVVRAGEAVRWTNRDVVAHTVTLDDGMFDSGLIEPGATFTQRFERPGTYPYHCTPHPFMRGVVIVR